jgi:hypothetical protein
VRHREAETELATEQVRPSLRIVHGSPTAEELAVVTAVVAAAGGGGDETPAPAVRGRWNDPAHTLRRPLHPGAGGWRAATRLP